MITIKKIIFTASLLGVFISGCSKEEESPEDSNNNNNTTSKTCKLTSYSSVRDSSQKSYSFEYNSSGKLLKLKVSYDLNNQDTRTDSVVYDVDGKINKIYEIDSYNTGFPIVYSYSYDSNGKITSIIEAGYNNSVPYTKTWTITYGSSGTMTQILSSGDPNGENASYKNITFSNGNINTVDMDFDGTGFMVIEMKVSMVDDKKNAGRFMLPKPDDLIEYFNLNNIVKVVTVNQELIPSWDDVNQVLIYDTIPAGSSVLERLFTYTSENEVGTMVEKPTIFDNQDQGDQTSTYTYDCQ